MSLAAIDGKRKQFRVSRNGCCVSLGLTFDTRNQSMLHSYDQVIIIVYIVWLRSKIITSFHFRVHPWDTKDKLYRHLDFFIQTITFCIYDSLTQSKCFYFVNLSGSVMKIPRWQTTFSVVVYSRKYPFSPSCTLPVAGPTLWVEERPLPGPLRRQLRFHSTFMFGH